MSVPPPPDGAPPGGGGGAYNSVPPPSNLPGGTPQMGMGMGMGMGMAGGGGMGMGSPMDFMAALKKAKERAAMLKENPNALQPQRVALPGVGSDESSSGLLSLVTSTTDAMGTITEIYHVPNDQVGRVIGKGGESINRIQDMSGSRVQMAQDNGTDKREATLSGTRESIDKARSLIADILAEGLPTNSFADSSGMKNIEIPIPSNKVGLVIGRGGETIKRLQEESGARLQMIQDDPFAEFKPLKLVGEAAAVDRATALVNDLISDRDLTANTATPYTLALDGMIQEDPRQQGQGGEGGPPGAEGQITAFTSNSAEDISRFRSERLEVKVPRFAVGTVIGRGGETIKRLQAESGARIQFEPETGNPDERICSVSGTSEMVKYAEKQILGLIEDCERRDRGEGGKYGPRGGNGKEVAVPAAQCGLVIGRGGESIKEIQSRSGAHVELDRNHPPDATEKVFKVSGTDEQIAEAERLIQEKISDDRSRGRGFGRGGPGGPGGPYRGGYGPPGAGYGAPGGPPGFGGYPGYGAPGGFPPYGGYPGYGGGGYGAPGGGAYAPGTQPEPAASAPAETAAATADAYPTDEEYKANIEWYNSQGYYGVVPAGAKTTASASTDNNQAQQETQGAAGSTDGNGGGEDYSAAWEEYYRQNPDARPK